MKEEEATVSMKQIMQRLRGSNPIENKSICEDFMDDVSTLVARMFDLYSCHPEILLAYGVKVEVVVSHLGEPVKKSVIGSTEVCEKFLNLMEEEHEKA